NARGQGIDHDRRAAADVPRRRGSPPDVRAVAAVRALRRRVPRAADDGGEEAQARPEVGARGVPGARPRRPDRRAGRGGQAEGPLDQGMGLAGGVTPRTSLPFPPWTRKIIVGLNVESPFVSKPKLPMYPLRTRAERRWALTEARVPSEAAIASSSTAAACAA